PLGSTSGRVLSSGMLDQVVQYLEANVRSVVQKNSRWFGNLKAKANFLIYLRRAASSLVRFVRGGWESKTEVLCLAEIKTGQICPGYYVGLSEQRYRLLLFVVKMTCWF